MTLSSSLPTEKPHRVCLAGDWHGDLAHGISVIEWANKYGAAGILQLGDLGIHMAGPRYLPGLDRELAARDMWLAFIHGNHENFDELERHPLVDGTRPITERITHLPAGYRWTWGRCTWLALGGATSLDVHRRIPGYDWWPQEAITIQQVERVIADGPVDYMLTHDAPAQARVPGLRPDLWREDALHTARQHQILLGTVVDVVRPRHLFHGHMHVRYGELVQLRDGSDCMIDGLAGNYEDFADNVLMLELGSCGDITVPHIASTVASPPPW